MSKCTICGNEHANKCPMIKAYEYYPDLDDKGFVVVKRVEFITMADFQQQPNLQSLPTHSTRQ